MTPPTLRQTIPCDRSRFAATGDFLLHAPVQRRASENAGGNGYSFAPMLTETSPIISGVDLAICHMETPMSEDDRALSGYPVFNVPREIATDAKAAGYDGCDTASNHTLDKGAAGITSTLDVLDAAGLKHTGSARSALEAVTPTIYDVHGVKVGHLAYAYGTNGVPMPADKPWSLNLIDADKILADAAAIKQAGADFVAVSLHWGTEYQSAPTPEQQALAHQLLASPDIDFIIGAHVHVVQPIEKIGDKYVAYGMGNFLSNQGSPNTPTPSQDGMILQVAVQEQPNGSFKATKVDYTPTWVDRSNVPRHAGDPAVEQGVLRPNGGGRDGARPSGLPGRADLHGDRGRPRRLTNAPSGRFEKWSPYGTVDQLAEFVAPCVEAGCKQMLTGWARRR